MKCLSLPQPWASLTILGALRHDTRTWQTSHRGPLAIHAARKFPDAARDLCRREPIRSLLLRHGIRGSADLPLGKVLGCVEMVGCVPAEQFGGDRDGGRPGPWAWVFLRPTRLAVPVPHRGQLGLFDIPDYLV